MRGRKRYGIHTGGAFALAVGCWLLMPSAQARAHTTFPGLGEFASGFLHPLTTPPHLLVLIALGLWIGQHPPLRIKGPAVVFGVVSAAALWLTVPTHLGGVYPSLLIAVGLCIGAGVVIDIPVAPGIKVGACGVAALLLGLDSGVEPGTAGVPAAKVLSATWMGLVLCLINAAFYVSLLPAARWVRTGIRVLGSWIVAVAFLLLAFAWRR